ncbi:MAG: tRNA uridine-5-carboxymethylaminomethyl(34) synthesis GTPase MnmE [Flavobacteriaceae bacterium]|nr:tRNA uridine-5-carboxymethylaminomethyl(34) synthesis GTPase MnmE [Flavobacteriaceae bacterium]
MQDSTIVALATASGVGAIAVIRVSGKDAISICDKVFVAKSKKKTLETQKSHSLVLGDIVDNNRVIDEVLASVFVGTNSYTGENTVEISCHGSIYIQQEIVNLLLTKGCSHAKPGEFTLRAFLNGKMDLSQAEAVADIIASSSKSAHEIAINQMRGGFSSQIKDLRQELLNFASLIELELDFSEEDVEFAERDEFKQLLSRISAALKKLIDSFALGNVLKNGIPVAIVGEPNVGKSTLLNSFLNEERAIVSSIAGTTRDAIEDEIVLGGMSFRFIDTAGIRETTDEIESIGIKKTFEKIEQSQVVLYLFDSSNTGRYDTVKEEISKIKKKFPSKKILLIANKTDICDIKLLESEFKGIEYIEISAKQSEGILLLEQELISMIKTGKISNNETIVSNSRHFEALSNSLMEVKNIEIGIYNGISADLLAIDIRQALWHMGEITGEVTNDELLGNIFANFCIGK